MGDWIQASLLLPKLRTVTRSRTKWLDYELQKEFELQKLPEIRKRAVKYKFKTHRFYANLQID